MTNEVVRRYTLFSCSRKMNPYTSNEFIIKKYVFDSVIKKLLMACVIKKAFTMEQTKNRRNMGRTNSIFSHVLMNDYRLIAMKYFKCGDAELKVKILIMMNLK